MSQVGIRVKGNMSLEKMAKHIAEQFMDLAEYQRIMEKAAKIAYDEACRLCPVADAKYSDSGKMKASIQVTYDGYLTFSLECLAPYASYNEYGWRGIPPVPDPPQTMKHLGNYHPFMRIGILKAEKYINEAMKKHKPTSKGSAT